eukprot:1937529-Amphidinium_carterae.1
MARQPLLEQEQDVAHALPDTVTDEPTTPTVTKGPSDDVLYTPTQSEAEVMCNDLSRSLTPHKHAGPTHA